MPGTSTVQSGRVILSFQNLLKRSLKSKAPHLCQPPPPPPVNAVRAPVQHTHSSFFLPAHEASKALKLFEQPKGSLHMLGDRRTNTLLRIDYYLV